MVISQRVPHRVMIVLVYVLDGKRIKEDAFVSSGMCQVIVKLWIGDELVNVELAEVEYVSHPIVAKTGPAERLIRF